MVDFAKILQSKRSRQKSYSTQIMSLNFAPNPCGDGESASIRSSVGSEKLKILSSLKQYVDPILETTPVKEVSGGQIIRPRRDKEDYSQVIEFTPKFSTWEDYLFALNKCSSCSNMCETVVVHEFAGSKFLPPLDLLFISDRPRELTAEVLSNINDQESRQHCFLEQKREMVEKMMANMQPDASKRALTLLTKCPAHDRQKQEELIWQKCQKNLFHELYFLRPKFVVTFGAWTTKMLIGKEDKISTMHGQFYPLVMQTPQELLEFTVVPLFHPDIIFINQEMKRTTWVDMQKIMGKL